MENHKKHSDDLKAIRKIMEESSRFLSLSGLSGLMIGIFALIGAFLGFVIIRDSLPGTSLIIDPSVFISKHGFTLMFIALIVLLASIISAYAFALQRCRKEQLSFWSPVTRRLLVNLSVPLIFGALFIMVLVLNNSPEYIIPAMLCFYGMALFNAGKFTFDEVRYLGIFEMVLGIIAGLFPGYGLILWVCGFSLLHILYGIILYRKYN